MHPRSREMTDRSVHSQWHSLTRSHAGVLISVNVEVLNVSAYYTQYFSCVKTSFLTKNLRRFKPTSKVKFWTMTCEDCGQIMIWSWDFQTEKKPNSTELICNKCPPSNIKLCVIINVWNHFQNPAELSNGCGGWMDWQQKLNVCDVWESVRRRWDLKLLLVAVRIIGLHPSLPLHTLNPVCGSHSLWLKVHADSFQKLMSSNCTVWLLHWGSVAAGGEGRVPVGARWGRRLLD